MVRVRHSLRSTELVGPDFWSSLLTDLGNHPAQQPPHAPGAQAWRGSGGKQQLCHAGLFRV